VIFNISGYFWGVLETYTIFKLSTFLTVVYSNFAMAWNELRNIYLIVSNLSKFFGVNF